MKFLSGKVISKKSEKTATIAVERIIIHPIYKKRIKRTKKYHVHDELGTEVGQSVKFVGSRPYSRTKRWKIVEIVEKGTEGKRKPVNHRSSENITLTKSVKSKDKSERKNK